MTSGKQAVFDTCAEAYTLTTEVWAAHQYERVLRFLPSEARRVLDAGCGAGEWGLRLADQVDHAVGIDLSPAMIALAKRRQADGQKTNVDFIIANLERLPFGDQSFDFVISRNALHRTPLEVTLPELGRVTKPGGRLFIQTLVTSHPRLQAWPAWHVFELLIGIPRLVLTCGLGRTWQILRFRTSRQWLQYVTSGRLMKPKAFQHLCQQILPGCSFEQRGRQMIVYWNASQTCLMSVGE